MPQVRVKKMSIFAASLVAPLVALGFLASFVPVANAAVSGASVTANDSLVGESDASYTFSFTTDTSSPASIITLSFPEGYSIENGTIANASSADHAVCNSSCALQGFISVGGVSRTIDNIVGDSGDNTIALTLSSPYDLSVGTVTFTLYKGITNPTSSGTTGTFSITTDASGETPETGISGVSMSPDSATHLVYHTQPGDSISGVSMTQPVVYAEDEYGNIDTSFDYSITLSVDDEAGDGSLTGGTTVTAVDGVATFETAVFHAGSDGESVSLDADDDDGGSATGIESDSFTSNVVATHIILSTTYENGSTSGQAFETQPVVEYVDDDGLVDTSDNSDAVTATVHSGAGSIVGTDTADAVNGVATFTDLGYQATADGESFVIRFTDGAGGAYDFSATPYDGPDFTSNVVATHLVFTTEPGSSVSGVSMTQPVVTAEDDSGLTDTDFTGSVMLSVSSGEGTLSGSTCVSAVDGVATFTDVVYHVTTGGTDGESFELTAHHSGLTSGVSSSTSSNVVATQIIVHTQPVGDNSGGAFSTEPVIWYVNADDVLDTSDNTDTVTAAVNSGTGSLVGTASVAADDGVVDFGESGLGFVYTSGTDHSAYTLSFTDDAGGTNNFSESPVISDSSTSTVVATQLVFTTEPSDSVSGVSMTQPVVAAEDAEGIIDTDFTGTVFLSLTSGAGSLSGTTSLSAVDGVATFSNVIYTATADHEDFVIHAASDPLTAVDASSISSNVVATHFEVTMGTTTPVAGTATTVALAAVDANGTVDVDYDPTERTFTLTDAEDADPATHVSPNETAPTIPSSDSFESSFTAGVGSSLLITFTKAEDFGTLSVTDGTLSGTSSDITVAHASHTHVVVIVPSTLTPAAGASVDETITLEDAYGNVMDDSFGGAATNDAVALLTNATSATMTQDSYTFINDDNGTKTLSDNIIFASAASDITVQAIDEAEGVVGTSADMTIGDSPAALAVNEIDSTSSYATPGSGFGGGFSWTFDVTVPDNETDLYLKFSDFTNGSGTIPADANIRYYSAQSSDHTVDSPITVSAANTYSETPMTLTGDLDPSTAGRQVQVTVQMQVPEDASGGSYSGSYGVESLVPTP